jgi:hypothetical protein
MLINTNSAAGTSISPTQLYKPPFPPVVIPGVNIAQNCAAIPAQVKVIIGSSLALTQSCEVPVSEDAPPMPGLVSQVTMGSCKTTTASVKLFFGGAPAVRIDDATLNNSCNAPGMRLPDSNIKVISNA